MSNEQRNTNKQQGLGVLLNEMALELKAAHDLAATSAMDDDKYGMKGAALDIKQRLAGLAALIDAVLAL